MKIALLVIFLTVFIAPLLSNSIKVTKDNKEGVKIEGEEEEK